MNKSVLQTREPVESAKELNKEVDAQFKVNMTNKMYDNITINLPFTEAELDNIIMKLKVRKCPGRDKSQLTFSDQPEKN